MPLINNTVQQANNGAAQSFASNPLLPMMPSGMIFVKGPNEAANFPMARGSRHPLFDSEEDVFYVKSVDVYGNVQPLKAYHYEEIPLKDECSTCGVSSEEFNSLKDEIAELKKLIADQNKQSFDKKPYRKENRNNG